MKRNAAILAKFGITISKEALILDFGCGVGRTVYSLLDQGFINAVGYDIRDYLSLRDPNDRSHFFIADAVGGEGADCRLTTTPLISSSLTRCWST
jgi:hypothetical protein